jgi:hypothetical protein
MLYAHRRLMATDTARVITGTVQNLNQEVSRSPPWVC